VIDAAVQSLNSQYPPPPRTPCNHTSSNGSGSRGPCPSKCPSDSRPRAFGTALNIRDPASIAALMKWIAEQHIGCNCCRCVGRCPCGCSCLLSSNDSSSPCGTPSASVDYLVNNAGGQFPSPAASISTKGWHAVIDTNLTGTFLLSQSVFANFFSKQDRGGASIVNVVANMHNGFPGMAHTGAARAGVVNLTKTLAVEWSPQGVRVNALAPGVIASSGLGRYDENMREMIKSSAAANNYTLRLGTEAECAAAILFLLCPASAFTTGACLNMDGAESLYAPLYKPQEGTKHQAWDDPEHESQVPAFLRKQPQTEGKIKSKL
jgi:NAD(P)-dependent dehydrogenase (short-subunit alcohol dehydrogenase family)